MPQSVYGLYAAVCIRTICRSLYTDYMPQSVYGLYAAVCLARRLVIAARTLLHLLSFSNKLLYIDPIHVISILGAQLKLDITVLFHQTDSL